MAAGLVLRGRGIYPRLDQVGDPRPPASVFYSDREILYPHSKTNAEVAETFAIAMQGNVIIDAAAPGCDTEETRCFDGHHLSAHSAAYHVSRSHQTHQTSKRPKVARHYADRARRSIDMRDHSYEVFSASVK